VGDDCSPYDLKSIADKFIGRLDIRYKRFSENLGGKDLVAQWERCIDMTEGEPWLWLFSDDDLMSADAVASVLHAIDSASVTDLLRLNVDVIDKHGKIKERVVYPAHMSCADYYSCKLSGSLNSYVVEFVFSRAHFFENKRFQKFDLGWGSDSATWLKLSKASGITTLPNGRIFWRLSGENITSRADKKIEYRKLKATIKAFMFYYKFWKCRHFFKTTGWLFVTSLIDLKHLLKRNA
jgi:hypothetical protein